MNEEVYPVIVLGSGPAGLTAALYIHRSGLEVLVLGGDSPGGKVTTLPWVENYPPFPGGVTGAELGIRWVKQVTDEVGAGPRPEAVTQVDLSGEIKEVTTAAGTYRARAVIVATGARPRPLGVPGEEELRGKGVFSCAMCDAPLLRTLDRQRALVVGGGNTALNTGLALLPHAEAVTVVTRGPKLRAQPVLVERLKQDPKSAFLFQRTVRTIEGEAWVRRVQLWNAAEKRAETMEVEAVFVGVGLAPTTEFLGGALEMDEEGFIKTDGELKTSVPGVFAAGDVRVSLLRQIVTAAADGAVAARSAVAYVSQGAG